MAAIFTTSRPDSSRPAALVAVRSFTNCMVRHTYFFSLAATHSGRPCTEQAVAAAAARVLARVGGSVPPGPLESAPSALLPH